MIGTMDNVTGSPCFLCGDPIIGGHVLHEFAEDQWELICVNCELTTGIGEGK